MKKQDVVVEMGGGSEPPPANEMFDEQGILVRNLLNYDAPHYFARFTLAGCPPGLEILDKYEHLLVNRRLQNLIDLEGKQLLLAYSQFDIKNSRGMQLYIALEKVTKKSLRWVRDARLFNVSFFDFHCRKVFTVRRKCGFKFCFAQYPCLFCTYGFQGCGNEVEVTLDDGDSKLGTVKQKLSFSSTILHVHNRAGQCDMIIDGVVADGILDVFLPGEEEPVAMIETLMTDLETFDFYRVNVAKNSSPYGITFFKNTITPEQKALLMGAVILLDFVTLKHNSDYPDFAEVIPDDFQEYPTPYSKIRRDGSKELVTLTERILRGKKSRRRKHHSYMKSTWACVFWCCQLLFICCLLQIRRNTVRCIGLALVASSALVISVVLIVYVFARFF